MALSLRLVLGIAASPAVHSGPTPHDAQLTFCEKRITIGYSLFTPGHCLWIQSNASFKLD
jgi:hypothetical protein